MSLMESRQFIKDNRVIRGNTRINVNSEPIGHRVVFIYAAKLDETPLVVQTPLTQLCVNECILYAGLRNGLIASIEKERFSCINKVQKRMAFHSLEEEIHRNNMKGNHSQD